MKIDKVASGHVSHTHLSQPAPKTQEIPTRPSVTEPELNVNTAALEAAQQEMATLPNVDMEKVAQIKNALQRGELGLDTHALSQAIMKFHTGHE